MKISQTKKAIFAAALGNFIEVYDYSHYMYFSTILASVFFSHSNHITSLTFIFGIYAIERLIRPIAGIWMGKYVDTHGRSKVLNYSVIGMVLASLFMCLIPTTASNYWLAPLIFLLVRLLQGLFISSEFVTCMVYITEISPKSTRGGYGSIAFFSGILGTLLSCILAFLITYYLSLETVQHWGWKIPYLFGLVILILTYKLRKGLIEPSEFLMNKSQQNTIRNSFTQNIKNIIFCIGLTIFSATNYSIFLVFMPTHLQTYKQLNLLDSIQLTSLNLGFYALLLPIMGILSDKIGKQKLITIACTLLLFSSYPVYYLLNTAESIGNLELILLSYMVLLAGLNGPLPAFLSELFPTASRATCLSIGYGASLSLAGGITPLICLYLPMVTNNIHSPGVYIMICALLPMYFLLVNLKKHIIFDNHHIKQGT